MLLFPLLLLIADIIIRSFTRYVLCDFVFSCTSLSRYLLHVSHAFVPFIVGKYKYFSIHECFGLYYSATLDHWQLDILLINFVNDH